MESTLPPPPGPPPTADAGPVDDPFEPSPPERRPLDRRLVVAALLCGVVFDLAVRRTLTSVSVALFLTATAVALLASGRLESAQSRRLMAAVPLFTVWLALRDSPWLIPLDLAAAALLIVASLATSGGTPATAIGPVQAIREVGLTIGSVVGNVGFVQRALTSAQVAAARAQGRPLLVGLGIMIPVVAVLAALLANGDALTDQVLASAGLGTWLGHVALILLGSWLVLGLLFRASSRDPEPLGLTGPLLGPVEAAVVLGGIVVLYAGFAALQVAGALGAASNLLDDPVNTADWAREGFFQLLWAAGLTLGVVLVLDRVVDRSDVGRVRSYRRLVAATCALTCVVVAVSVIRIARYSDAFGLTMLRLYAGLFALWIAAVFALVAVRAAHHRPPSWLTLRAGTVGLGMLFALNVVNPEALVVRADTTSAERFDVDYLTSQLSTDSVPTLIDRMDVLNPRQRGDLIRELCADDPPPSDGWLSWNRSRHQARERLIELCGTPGR
ncbi:MAG: DUF4173 domain-containing protein [Actinomycetota bacterium]